MKRLITSTVFLGMLAIKNALSQEQVYEAPSRMSFTTFLAIAILIIVLIVLFWSLRKKKHKK
ncbi:MAG: hypothetical protein AABW41_04600 [Nanoarchaeota archaeon]